MPTTTKQISKAEANRVKAMSHPLRAKIHLLLAERPGTPADVVDRLLEDSAFETGLSRSELTSEVTHHCKYLVHLDCAEVVDERKRGARTYFTYKAIEQHVVYTEDWEDLPHDAKEANSAQFAQTQVDTLVEWRRAGGGRTSDFHVTSDRYWLDDEGFERFMEITEEARLAYEAAAAEAEGRLVEAGGKGHRVAGLLTCVKLPQN